MKIIYSLNQWMGYLAVTVLGLLMLLTVVDVAGRYFFNSPITGTTEISRLMMVLIVFPALGWAALGKMHVRVDLLVTRFSPKTQAIFGIITLIISLGVYFVITWQSFLESAVVKRQTSLLQISFTPFYWVMSVGFAMFCLSIVVLVIENIIKEMKK